MFSKAKFDLSRFKNDPKLLNFCKNLDFVTAKFFIFFDFKTFDRFPFMLKSSLVRKRSSLLSKCLTVQVSKKLPHFGQKYELTGPAYLLWTGKRSGNYLFLLMALGTLGCFSRWLGKIWNMQLWWNHLN